MELTPDVVRNVEFREKFRGYHPDDVDAFLEEVVKGLEELLARVESAEPLAEAVPFDAVAGAEAALGAARREADEILARAREEAAHLLDESELSAQRSALRAEIAALEAFIEEQQARLRRLLNEQLVALGQWRADPPRSIVTAAPRGAVPASSAPEVETSAEGVVDVVSRGRHAASRLPGVGEEDPFLDQLRAAVGDVEEGPSPAPEASGAVPRGEPAAHPRAGSRLLRRH